MVKENTYSWWQIVGENAYAQYRYIVRQFLQRTLLPSWSFLLVVELFSSSLFEIWMRFVNHQWNGHSVWTTHELEIYLLVRFHDYFLSDFISFFGRQALFPSIQNLGCFNRPAPSAPFLIRMWTFPFHASFRLSLKMRKVNYYDSSRSFFASILKYLDYIISLHILGTLTMIFFHSFFLPSPVIYYLNYKISLFVFT